MFMKMVAEWFQFPIIVVMYLHIHFSNGYYLEGKETLFDYFQHFNYHEYLNIVFDLHELTLLNKRKKTHPERSRPRWILVKPFLNKRSSAPLNMSITIVHCIVLTLLTLLLATARILRRDCCLRSADRPVHEQCWPTLHRVRSCLQAVSILQYST